MAAWGGATQGGGMGGKNCWVAGRLKDVLNNTGNIANTVP